MHMMSTRRANPHDAAGRPPGTRLPVLVLALAALAGATIMLPLVGLGTRVAWADLPTLLASDSARAALGLSLRTCLAATAVSLLLGVAAALVLARDWPGVRAARVLAVLPMTMPPVVSGIALLAAFGKRGMLGPALEAAGWQISFTTLAVVIAQVFVSMPYLVVTLEAALRTRDAWAETVARTLGASEWAVLLRITLPLVAPALARGTALALGRSLGEFGATIAFAGSREGVTRTMPLAIYLERENDQATSLALAVVLIAASALVVALTNMPWTRLVSWAGRRPAAHGRRRPSPSIAPSPSARRLGGPAPAGQEPAGAAGSAAAGHSESEAGALSSPHQHAGSSLPVDPDPARRAGLGVSLSVRSQVRDVSVDLEVSAGQALALIGPNGSGKSTACNALAGLLRSGGQVRMGDRLVDDAATWVPAGRRQVALLAQQPGVFTHMSVLDNVAFGPRCQGQSRSAARQRALAELEAVGAAHLAGRRGGELSGGQAARVALARALATDPGVLVLDEPTAALDVTARAELRQLVAQRTRRTGTTLVLVTHDVLDLTALARQVVVLEAGRVVQSGSVEEVLTRPASGFAAQITGTSVLAGTVTGTPDQPALLLPGGHRLSARPQENPAHNVARGADEASSGVGTPAQPAPLPGDHLAGRPRASRAHDEARGKGKASSGVGTGYLSQGSPAIALVPPDAVALYRLGAQSGAGSPRNRLEVEVTATERAGAVVTVRLAVLGEPEAHLSALVTAGALAELAIAPGSRLQAVIKAVQVRLLPRG